MTERTSFDQYLDEQLADDEFRREYELARAQIAAVDDIVRRIDTARTDLGMSKADLARAMRVKPSAVRRLLTEQSPNPTIATLAKAAYACLLYTSDAADDLTRVDLGGRRIIN